MTGGDLKEARLAHGWTQEQLGEMLGETKAVIGNWERGKRVPPRKEHAVLAVLYPAEGDTYLRGLSDTALIAELARRLAERDSASRVPQLMQGETDFSEKLGPSSVEPRRTSASGTAGPHSAPRRPRDDAR